MSSYQRRWTIAAECARVSRFHGEPRLDPLLVRRLFPIISLVLLALAASAAAAPDKGVPRLIFPVVGAVEYSDDFGDPRAGGTHEGNDILAARHAPAVAVEAGTVKFWTTSAQAGCMLYLYGASGTTYLYIHLNNDLTSHNDNRGSCIAGTSYAPGLKSGAHVAAGQLVGYVGDSGDANGIHPHLHFEVHPGDGAAVSPYPYLKKARPLLFYAKKGTTVSVNLTGTVVSSLDGFLKVKASEVQINSAPAVETEQTSRSPSRRTRRSRHLLRSPRSRTSARDAREGGDRAGARDARRSARRPERPHRGAHLIGG